MVNAIVLINVERNRVKEVAEELIQMDGVTEVFSVAGQWDLVALLRTRNNEGIADLVTGQILGTRGITRTETLIAFRVYSRYDLERMFSIGADE